MSSQISDSKIFWFRLGVVAILLVWFGLFTYWMHHNFYVSNPYEPGLTGTARYGRNDENGFFGYLKILAVETFILLVILRPLSFRPECWIRCLVALILCGGWSFLMLATAMHNSSLHMIHLVALLALDALLLALTLFCVIVNLQINNRHRHTNFPTP